MYTELDRQKVADPDRGSAGDDHRPESIYIVRSVQSEMNRFDQAQNQNVFAGLW